MNRRRKSWVALLVVPLVLATLAAGVLIGIVNTGTGPQDGVITSRELIDGEMVARIEAQAPYNTGELIVGEVVLPPEYHTATTIPVRVLSDWSIEIAETGFRLPRTGLLAIFAGLGALAGLVIVFNARGYGFVRGTGEAGTMQPSDVDEDRGFYWRS
jgi:hypothetical protein